MNVFGDSSIETFLENPFKLKKEVSNDLFHSPDVTSLLYRKNVKYKNSH